MNGLQIGQGFTIIKPQMFRIERVRQEPYALPNPLILGERKMRTMSYEKEKVLNALVKNREEHAKIVQEAQKGYREKAIEAVEKLLADLKEGKRVSLHIPLDLPVSHLDDFDRVIEMLRMTINPMVELDEGEFQTYVRNKWNWQRQFLESNAVYSPLARSSWSNGD